MHRVATAAMGILVLSLAVYLLVSYTVKAREAARRVTCCGNAYQFVVAVHNYHDSHGRFPCGAEPNPNLPVDKRLSWILTTLPFLERLGSPREIDASKSWDSAYYTGYVDIRLRFAQCPSSRSRAPLHAPALTDYVGIGGVGKDAATLPMGSSTAGFFGYDRITSLQDIKDGTSTTLVVVETSWNNGPWAAGGDATTRGIDRTRQPYNGSGHQFGGLHAGGAVCGFADGSVRFVHETVTAEIWEAMATIAGGEEVERVGEDVAY